MHILEEKIRKANAEGRKALIPFLTAGFPDQLKFWPTLLDLDHGGADIIEIGVPFSDPVADGPVVEAASRLALSEGVQLVTILKELQERRSLINAAIVLMGYYNPFLQYGLERLAKDAKKCQIAGFIVPDLPYEEAEKLRSLLHKEDIALIPLIGQNTSLKRMQLYAQVSMGYAYVVSVMGVTGARQELPTEVSETLMRAKQAFSIPLALGFGLKEPKQLANLDQKLQPEAVIFGSALLQHIEAGKLGHEFLARWL